MTRLAQHFRGISAKRLSGVETLVGRSNQHELNGTRAMRDYLGTARREMPACFILVGSGEGDRLSRDGTLTWYDARERHPERSEYRLYFRDNDVMSRAVEGDMLITALGTDGRMLLLVVPRDSDLIGQVLWLFGIPELQGTSFVTVDTHQAGERSDVIFRFIAEELGLELAQERSDTWLDLLLSRFGDQFPATRALSALALETLQSDIEPVGDPDGTLMRLMDREELLFRELEAHVVARHLRLNARSWVSDVDEFIRFSLSVQNRRKSRAGHALENHLEWILQEVGLGFSRGAATENRSRPDFLFPGAQYYYDSCFPQEALTMLGVKTSCRDRWRQVLNEAHRIPAKHLLTLQPAISEHQTREMGDAGVSLVIPSALHDSFGERQRSELLSLQDFIGVVKDRQERWLRI